MTREKKLLLWLLGLLCLAGVYSWWRSPVQQRIEKPAGEPAAAAQSQRPGADREGSRETALHLELLAGGEAGFGRIERDIFSFKAAAPPPPPRIEQPVPPPPPSVPQPVQSVAPVPTGPVPARFDFLGSLEKEGRQLVFLASGPNIYLVAEGQRFGGQDEFLLKRVEAQSLSIEQQGIAQPIRVQTVEPEVPVPSSSSPGLGFSPESPEATPHPLQRFNRALPRLRNFNPNRGNP